MSNHTSRLPSYQSAVDFIQKPNAENTVKVIGSWIGRSLIVATAMGLVGKSFEESLKDGMVAATAIEVFVLGHAVYEVKLASQDAPALEVQKTKP